MQKFPKWDLKGYSPSCISRSESGIRKVYRIGEEKVVKIYDRGCQDHLLHEWEIAKLAWEENLSIPYPEGLFSVPVGGPGKRNNRGIVMEYIEGIRLDDLIERAHDPQEEVGGILQLHKLEIQKAIHRGFIVGDVGIVNAIFQPRKIRVVLYDFQLWLHKMHKCNVCHNWESFYGKNPIRSYYNFIIE